MCSGCWSDSRECPHNFHSIAVLTNMSSFRNLTRLPDYLKTPMAYSEECVSVLQYLSTISDLLRRQGQTGTGRRKSTRNQKSKHLHYFISFSFGILETRRHIYDRLVYIMYRIFKLTNGMNVGLRAHHRAWRYYLIVQMWLCKCFPFSA